MNATHVTRDSPINTAWTGWRAWQHITADVTIILALVYLVEQGMKKLLSVKRFVCFNLQSKTKRHFRPTWATFIPMEWDSAFLITVVVGWHTVVVHKTSQNKTVLKWTGRAEQQNSIQKVAIKISPLFWFISREKKKTSEKILHAVVTAINTTVHAIWVGKWHAATVRSTFLLDSGAVVLCQMQGFQTGEPMKTDVYLAMSCRREPGRPELHLSEGNGGIFTLPVYPDYSLCENRDKWWYLVCV